MARTNPRPITASERLAREKRIGEIAGSFGFVGRIEYRHVHSLTGGAQYGLGESPAADLLTVYAEAFERDADPDDFSLEAIIAHERGHQLLARHRRLRQVLPHEWSGVSEEIAASILGSLLAQNEKDQQDLMLKAMFDADRQGLKPTQATKIITELRTLLERII
jgi:hypothetical protein